MTENKAAPYAYTRWVCSECDGEPVSERNADADADLRCETCGHLFRSSVTGYAEYVPYDEDEVDEDEGSGESS